MTDSRRMMYLKDRIELLKNIKRNSSLSHFDLVESHRFLKCWIGAYHLGHIIVKIQAIPKYITILGPLWDFLKEYDLEINNHRDRIELIANYIHSRQHS